MVRLIIGALFLILLTGCASVEYTDRSQVMFYNKSQDAKIGAEAWEEIKKASPPITDSIYLPPLRRVGADIATAANRPDYQWEFAIIAGDQENAFALPGGKVAFYEPIFKYFDNDAELATVMSHEVAHALARHGLERQSQGALQNIFALPLYFLFESQAATSAAVGVYNAATEVGAMLPYSRLQETEADFIGLILMAQAGYDPNAAIAMWNKFGATDKTGKIAGFFSTHPRTPERIAEMQRRLPEAIEYYKKSKVKHGLGEKIPRK